MAKLTFILGQSKNLYSEKLQFENHLISYKNVFHFSTSCAIDMFIIDLNLKETICDMD